MLHLHNDTGKSKTYPIFSENPKCLSNQCNNFLFKYIPVLLEKFTNKEIICNIKTNQQSMFVKPVSTNEIEDSTKHLHPLGTRRFRLVLGKL